MTDMSDERRSAKLHKQTEVEDDDAGDILSSTTADVVTISTVSGGIPTPTVQSASSSSGTSPDEPQPKVVVPPPITRKQTLLRGIALEGTSPPPESFFSQLPPIETVQDCRLLTNGSSGTCTDKNWKKGQSHEAKESLLASHKISNDSGHGTIDHNDGASDTSVLSRDSSLENACIKDVYKDSSGVNIPKFMKDTLQKSAKDRKTILSYEDQLLNFVNNESAQTHKMAEMTSYDRMIVHRLAAFLGLEHNVDSTGKCVILSRTENTRNVKLSDLIMFTNAEQEPKKKILLKKPSSLDEKHSRGSKAPFASIRAKSLEERQQNYIEARERIFNQNEENQPDGASATPNLLTANYVPHIHHQRSLDSMRSSGHLSTNWMSTDSSGYSMDCNTSLTGARLRAGMTKTNSYSDSMKDSPMTHYGSPPIIQTACQMSLPMSAPCDHSHISRSTPDAGPSPITQSLQYPQLAYLVSSDYNSIPVGSLIINPLTMQPHVNADGSLYHFDPTCPPPFMVQPQAQTPPAHIVYHNDNIPDLSARLAATSMGSIDQGNETYTAGIPGQPIPIMPTVIPHIQSMYTTAHPSQLPQGQYFAAPSPINQQPIRYVAIPYSPSQGQQLLQATPVDCSGQTTVPMPAIGIPAIPGPGGYQVVGSPYQQSMTGGSPAHCLDFSSAAYHYGPVSEAMVVNRTGCHNTSSNMGTPHLILTYSQPQPAQQQHTILPSHQSQFTSAGGTTQGTYFTVPVSSPTPPLALTQPTPSSHHHHQQQPQQHHQPTVFYTTSIRNPLNYPVTASNPISPSTSTLKSVPTPIIQTHYRPSTPPQQHHHHQPQQPQPAVIASSNGHHPAQLTLNYSHPVPFNPSQPMTPVAAAQGSHLVTFQPNSYQVRPVGTTLIQLSGNPIVQAQQPVAVPQVQSYQLVRPTGGSISDLRMVTPSSIRPRLSSAQSTTTSPNTQPTRHKYNSQYRQNKRANKKFSASRDDIDYQGAQADSIDHQTGHINIMTPFSLSGPIPQPQSHLPSTSSHMP
uniref:SUZ domain-containing protein n=1 Tax=Arion vulgaris TaxID=1028688 RepID=A0A0B7AUG6_9EUPU